MIRLFVLLVVATPAALPFDAATLAALIFGAISPVLLKAVPLKDNAMIAVTWTVTFLVALAAVLAVDQLQHIVFTWTRLLIDIGAAYTIQAGLFTLGKHNAPALVT
jgi:hypothetical protein